MTFKGSLGVLAGLFPNLFKAGMSQEQFDSAAQALKNQAEISSEISDEEKETLTASITASVKDSLEEMISGTISSVIETKMSEVKDQVSKVENSLTSKEEGSFIAELATLKSTVSGLKSDVDDLSSDEVAKARKARITHADDGSIFKPFVQKDETSGAMSLKLSSKDLIVKPTA